MFLLRSSKGPVGETGKGMDGIGTTGTAFSSADDDDPRCCYAPSGVCVCVDVVLFPRIQPAPCLALYGWPFLPLLPHLASSLPRRVP